MSTSESDHNRMKIKPWISCPHCWYEFPTDQILFISESPDLLGDLKLGDIEQLRFVPYRFDLDGTAEANVENVTYIAVSATGTSPEVGQPDKEGKCPLMFRPANIKPIWAEVPFFHAQVMAGKYCVPVLKKNLT